MDPKCGFSRARVFHDLPRMLEMAGIGNEGGAYQVQCGTVAVQPRPYTLRRREAQPFPELSPPRATASPCSSYGSRRACRIQISQPPWPPAVGADDHVIHTCIVLMEPSLALQSGDLPLPSHPALAQAAVFWSTGCLPAPLLRRG